MVRPSRAGAPLWLTDQVNGREAGLFESVPLTGNAPPLPEVTVWFAMALTVGAKAALTATVLVAVLAPQLLVTVRDKLTEVAAATDGAVKLGDCAVASERVPAVAVQAQVKGPVPVDVPISPIVPPEAAA
jgi:hypothetical protein